jgi:hypothetical protein
MDKRKAIEGAGDEPATRHDLESEHPKVDIELPFVASPSISPAEIEPSLPAAGETRTEFSATSAEEFPSAESVETTSAPVVASDAQAPRKYFAFDRGYKRYALRAASMAIAAALGAVAGAAVTGAFTKPAMVDIAVEENKTTQQSIARLAKDLGSLKTSLESASESANSQFSKISERLDREKAEITGSIAPAQTIPPAPASLAPPRAASTAIEPHSSRRPIVTNWSIREARGGYIYVQGHGDIYQVTPGAPLPGLGPVEQIKRQDGRWLVVTPKGIIVSMRDRRYFEQF